MSALPALLVWLPLACDPAPVAEEAATEPAAAAAPAPASPHGAAGARAADTPRTVTGTVTETIDAAGYTYLQLDTADGPQWAAVSQVDVEVGQPVTLVRASTMTDFHSRSLDRTFETILFAQLEGADTPTPTATAAPAAAPVEPAAGPDARTVAQVHAEAAELAGKPVAVRGRVVKFNPAIMDTNWVHLQDGSGSAGAGDHDLTITTDDTVGVGDVVTLRGTVAADKDFGAGYRFGVIVEGATVEDGVPEGAAGR